MNDIDTLNAFLPALADSQVWTPEYYMTMLSVRAGALGFVIDKTSSDVFSAQHGDIYIPFDQWVDANEPDVNQLERKYGTLFFINLVWVDYGNVISAKVVTEDEMFEDDEDYTDSQDNSFDSIGDNTDF
jgi:hypothetical protein